jgi:hypothetical protein
MKTASDIQTIAFLGNYLPRKCGIATFTSDLLEAVAAHHPQSRCFAVPVNDSEGRYSYLDAVRFEIEEQDRSGVLPLRSQLPEHQRRGRCLAPARVRDLWWPGRRRKQREWPPTKATRVSAFVVYVHDFLCA